MKKYSLMLNQPHTNNHVKGGETPQCPKLSYFKVHLCSPSKIKYSTHKNCGNDHWTCLSQKQKIGLFKEITTENTIFKVTIRTGVMAIKGALLSEKLGVQYTSTLHSHTVFPLACNVSIMNSDWFSSSNL